MIKILKALLFIILIPLWLLIGICWGMVFGIEFGFDLLFTDNWEE